jgi:hypothetical protein
MCISLIDALLTRLPTFQTSFQKYSLQRCAELVTFRLPAKIDSGSLVLLAIACSNITVVGHTGTGCSRTQSVLQNQACVESMSFCGRRISNFRTY